MSKQMKLERRWFCEDMNQLITDAVFFHWLKLRVNDVAVKSPDEWATTKQACRDESVVYLFLSSTNIYFALH